MNILSDSSNSFFSYIQGAETVIISYFSSTVSTIISSVGDEDILILIIAVFWILWITANTIADFILNKLWYDNDDLFIYNDYQLVLMKRFGLILEPNKKKPNNKSWHEIIIKIRSAMNLLFMYIVIEMLLSIIKNGWSSFSFSTFQSLIAILITLIILYSIIQIFSDLKLPANQIMNLLNEIEKNEVLFSEEKKNQ